MVGGLLESSVSITDDAWHRVGFVWDGSHRALHVDGVEVANNAAVAPRSSTGSLKIGGAFNGPAGTFWSGLIDDVRIYSRAVRPAGK